jgi:peptidoglycan/xylan/chitin deacetylase (PgdA/CDA1 family)
VDAGEMTAPRWPGGHRAALCVSIDVDGRYGEANYRSPDDTYWISQTAYDATGTVRFLELLADFGVEATFCWVGRVAEEQPVLLRRCVAEGHEIALHTWDHRSYNRLGRDEQREDMRKTYDTLHRLGGMEPAGHKTGGWRYDEHTFALAQELGLTWVMDEPGGDLPYFVQPDGERPPVVQLPPSRLWDDYAFFVDQTVTPQAAFEFWRDDLDVLRDEGGLMCLTLHPFVSGRPGPSRAVSRLLDYAIDLGDLWLARADHVARWWIERSQA